MLSVRYNSDGSLDTSFNVANTLDATATFIENGTAVLLDNNVQIFDAELSAINNFNGATLTLQRTITASSDDVFSSAVFSGADVLVSGTNIGSFTQNNGVLNITFNNNATQTLISSALQQIQYRNSSDAPPASVQIDWTFSDGNTGAQGTGGAKSVTDSSTVYITTINDNPTGTATATAPQRQL